LPDRRAAVLAVLGALGAVLVTLWHSGEMRAFLDRERDAVTASPGLAALFQRAVVRLDRGERACMAPVTLYADTGRARFRLRVPKRLPALAAEIRAPGYAAQAAVRGLDRETEQLAEVTFPEPGREVTGRFCWVNGGRSYAQLIGNGEGRSLSPTELTVDGRHVPNAELELILLERQPVALRDRPGELVDRAASMTGGLAPAWILWPALVLLLASPLIVAVTFGLSVWRAERAPGVRAGRAPGRPGRRERGRP
jgi:hypothetical protein